MAKKIKKSKQFTGLKKVLCSHCEKTVLKIDINSVSGKCWKCVALMCDPPKLTTQKKSGKPQGWHFMHEYVHKDGTVYHKGEEQPDLFGTLEPTKFEANTQPKTKRLSKKEKENIKISATMRLLDLRKELKTVKTKKKRKELESEVKKVQKLMK